MQHELDNNLTNNFECILATTFEQIENLRPVWEKLYANESRPIINADIDRYLSVVKAIGEDAKPYVMVLKQNGQAAVMMIGRIEKHQLRLKLGYKNLFSPSLNSLTIIYGGILGQPSQAVCVLLVNKLIEILHHHEVDVVYFNNMRTDSHIYQLSRKIPGILCRGYFPKIEPHWQTELPASPEVLYESFSRKRKKEWKRLSRRLEDAAGTIDVKSCCDESQVDLFAATASKISAMTYKDALGVGVKDTSRMRTLLIQAAQADRWRAYVLYAGDEPCAFESGIIYGRTYFAEAIGYDPHRRSFSPGTILFVKVLEELCSNPRVDFFDYGFGNAEYKERFGTESWLEAPVYIFAPGFYPILINMLHSITMGINIGLEYLLNKIGFVGRIKQSWRNLLVKNNIHTA
jgi:hypothetical protein